MKKYIVHVEDKKESRPRPHETEAAEKIAQIFKSDLVFMRRRAKEFIKKERSRIKRLKILKKDGKIIDIK